MEERQRPREIVVKKVRPGGVRVRAEARREGFSVGCSAPPGPLRGPTFSLGAPRAAVVPSLPWAHRAHPSGVRKRHLNLRSQSCVSASKLSSGGLSRRSAAKTEDAGTAEGGWCLVQRLMTKKTTSLVFGECDTELIRRNSRYSLTGAFLHCPETISIFL